MGQEILAAQQRLADKQRALKTTSHPNSSPTATAPALCDFCGVERAKLDFGGIWSLAIYHPCECDGARARRAAEEQAEIDRKKEEVDKEKFYRIKSLFAEIPEHFRSRTFEAFEVTEHNRDAHKMAQGFPFLEGKNSLLFMGKPGLGKTHLAAAVAIRQVNMQKSVIFGTVPTILGRIKATFSGEGATESQVTSAIMGCSLLVLDDLGKEKTSDWVEEKLYEIINARYERRLPVVITTNVGMKAVESRYPWNGEAIVSRLFEMCRGVQLTGDDYRRRR